MMRVGKYFLLNALLLCFYSCVLFVHRFRDLSQDVTYKDYKTWKKLIAQAKFDEFLNHDVIICTCATAAGTIRRGISETHPSIQGFLHCFSYKYLNFA